MRFHLQPSSATPAPPPQAADRGDKAVAKRTRGRLRDFCEYAMEDLHLVYTPMKVGSKTIATAIRTSDLGGKVAHFHFLSDWGLNWLEEKIRNDQRADVWIKQLDESVRLRAVLAARESLAAHGRTVGLAPRKPFNVTAIRESLGLHFSLMFETSWLFVLEPWASPTRFSATRSRPCAGMSGRISGSIASCVPRSAWISLPSGSPRTGGGKFTRTTKRCCS